jgi:hypothetical protein
MRASRDELRTGAFVATWDDILRLHDIMAERGREVQISAECADKLTRRFDGLDQLENYENQRARAITALSLSAESRDPEHVQIRLKLNTGDGPNLRVDISAEEGEAMKIGDALDARLEGMAPWWSWMWAKSFWQVVILVLTATLISNLAVVVLARSIGWDVGSYITILPLGLTIVLYGLRTWLFPIGAFLIGQEKGRAERRSRIRDLVFVVIGLGIVVSVIANKLSKP